MSEMFYRAHENRRGLCCGVKCVLQPAETQSDTTGRHQTAHIMRALRPSTYFVGQQLLQGLSSQAAGLQLLAGLVRGLPLHQRLGLGQEIGRQNLWSATGGENTHTHTHSSMRTSKVFLQDCICDPSLLAV